MCVFERKLSLAAEASIEGHMTCWMQGYPQNKQQISHKRHVGHAMDTFTTDYSVVDLAALKREKLVFLINCHDTRRTHSTSSTIASSSSPSSRLQ
jgi:hypothetical protein